MAERKKAPRVTLCSAEVIGALRKSTVLNSEDARSPCVMLEEVRNGTGYGSRQRYADAFVVSLWPSRGIWFAGVEVKVSRSDWVSELKAPAKAAEILQWCDYWWLATAEGVAKPEEIPETWGWIEVIATEKTTKCEVRKQAPRLNPEAPSREFVASVLRNVAAQEAHRDTAAFNKAYRQLLDNRVGIDETEVARLKATEKDHKEWLRRFSEFCEASGESMDAIRFNAKNTGKARALAEALISGRRGRWDLPNQLRKMASDIEAAQAELERAESAGEAALTNAPVALGLTQVTNGV